MITRQSGLRFFSCRGHCQKFYTIVELQHRREQDLRGTESRNNLLECKILS